MVNGKNDLVNIIGSELSSYEGFTTREKEYCQENLSSWISNENGLTIMIDKLAEKSLDVKPFLEKLGLIDKS